MAKRTNQLGYKKYFPGILALFFFIFPWITYLTILEYNEAEMSVFSSMQGYAADFFLFAKQKVLYGFIVFIVLWFLGERVFPDKVDNNIPLFKGRNKNLFLLSGIFVFMAVISAIFSSYKKTALWGSPTEAEGLFVLFSYVILIYVFYNYMANENGMKFMKCAVLASAVCTVLLSFVERLYKPLIQIELIQKLIAPSKYQALLESINGDTFGGAVSLTFYNPSYYAGYLCLLLPFCVMCYLQEKDKVRQLLYILLNVGLIICVFASNSTTAAYLMVLELILVVFLFGIIYWKKKNLWIKLGLLLLTGVIIILVYVGISGESILDLYRNANSAQHKVVEDRFEIQDLILDENKIKVVGDTVAFQIQYDKGQISVTDGQNASVDVAYKDGILRIEEPAYKNVSIEMIANNEAGAEIVAKIAIDAGYDDTIDFYILNDGTISGVGQNNSVLKDIGDNMDVPEFLEKYYGIFTGRGYAWIHSWPALSQAILKGVGPGNFAYYFKQQDYMGMLSTHGSVKYMIDKPHNAYIQYGVHVGWIGMVAFWGFFIFTICRGIKGMKQVSAISDCIASMHLAGIAALIGFLIYSVINDSIITVTPIACMIAGIVLATSYVISEKTYGN